MGGDGGGLAGTRGEGSSELTETSETSETDSNSRFRRAGRLRSWFPTAHGDDSPDAAAGTLRPGFRQDIEGLRAIAVLGVILFHAGVRRVDGGFVGVDVFFVISGFLITGILVREVTGTGKIGLRRFYGARARRLLPASATVGVFIAISTALLVGPLQARGIYLDGIASALYVSNYRFALEGIDYLGATKPPSPYEHYWSLGVEEQFYLIWPALIIGTAWLIRRRASRRTGSPAHPAKTPYIVVLGLVAAVSFALSLIATRALPPFAFFSLPTRAWELAAGGLVALTVDQWRRLPALAAAVAGWAGLLLILLAFFQLNRATPYPGTAGLLPVLGTALVIGAGCAAPALGCGPLLALPPMRAIGRLSYAWYLTHWPVLLALYMVPTFLVHPQWLAPALIVISGGLAWLLMRVIENPFRFRPRWRRSPGLSLALGGAVTAMAVGVCAAMLVLLPKPVGHGPAAPALAVKLGPTPTGQDVEPFKSAVHEGFAQVQTAVAASANLKAVPSNLEPTLYDAQNDVGGGCNLDFLSVDPPECATGDTASSTTVALVGDSNAAMWSPALQEIATQRKWRLETMAKSGCPMLQGLPVFNATLREQYRQCDQWRTNIAARLKAERPRLIVLAVSRQYGKRYDYTSSYDAYDATWTSKLDEQVRQFRATGAKVLVLGSIPNPQLWVPNCLSLNLDNATACSPLRSAAVNKTGIAAEMAAAQSGGGHYADVSDLFCTEEICPAIVGNTLVYRDFNHATNRYIMQLAPVLGALADLALVEG